MIIRSFNFFLGGLFNILSSICCAMPISITVDDLPVNGDLTPNISRVYVVNKLLEALKAHHIEHVYGFMNGGFLEETTDGLDAINIWRLNGNILGNHTFGHLDLAKTNSQTYIDDIIKNDLFISQLMGENNRYFRYPYLAEGNTQEKRSTVREFLLMNNYKITPVTVDFFDYEWNAPYLRCSNKKDKKAIKWLKKTYIEQALNALIIAHELSLLLYQRDINNILLIHINAFSAEMLDELLTAYENQNISFIPLEEALNDPVYQDDPNIISDRSYTFLNQKRLSLNLDNPDIVDKLYRSLPADELYNLCR